MPECSAINPRNSLRQSAKDFVGHAFAPTRQFYCVHAFTTASAGTFADIFTDQDDFISHRNAAYAADVHDRQVHRDPSHNRRVFAVYDYPRAIREQAWITVRVSDWQHRDAALRFGHEGAHVTHCLSRGDL